MNQAARDLLPPNAAFVYKQQHVAPILVTENAMGSRIPIDVKGVVGYLVLPSLGSVALPEFREVIAPESPLCSAIADLSSNQQEEMNWGSQVQQPTGECAIYSWIFEFVLNTETSIARYEMGKLEKSLEPWMDNLRDWIEVATYQDLSINEPLDGVDNEINLRWFFEVGGDVQETTSSAPLEIVMSMPSETGAISRSGLIRAAELVAEDVSPSPEHILLRDARRRFHRHDYGYSVIFAAVAAEISLKSLIANSMGDTSRTNELTRLLLKEPFGGLIEIAKALKLTLPVNLRKKLVETRNHVIHNWRSVGHEEAYQALVVATELVAQLRSLPDWAEATRAKQNIGQVPNRNLRPIVVISSRASENK